MTPGWLPQSVTLGPLGTACGAIPSLCRRGSGGQARKSGSGSPWRGSGRSLRTARTSCGARPRGWAADALAADSSLDLPDSSHARLIRPCPCPIRHILTLVASGFRCKRRLHFLMAVRRVVAPPFVTHTRSFAHTGFINAISLRPLGSLLAGGPAIGEHPRRT
jgi:hypothetical protein